MLESLALQASPCLAASKILERYILISKTRRDVRQPGAAGKVTAALSKMTVASILMAASLGSASASDLTYLQSLLAATSEGGWVKASTNKYSDAWAPAGDGVSGDVFPYSYASPGNVVTAWSSFAWDTARGNLLLWGGGHGNYRGNEIYTWQGSTGAWTRGSLPSLVVPYAGSYVVADDAAPMSAHTYSGNTYLQNNDMFVAFGGAVFNSGGAFMVRDGQGGLTKAGPWLWDPTKADAMKVGGTTGSGYNPTRIGGQMWTNRFDQTTAVTPSNFIYASTVYQNEAGVDVVYMYADPSGGNRGNLYKYTVGDVRNGGTDTWEKIGVTANTPTTDNAAAIDSLHGLFVHTSATGYSPSGLGVWSLANANAGNPSANQDTFVSLVNADGSAFQMSKKYGIDYDAANDKFLLWDNTQAGTVWVTQAAFNLDGSVANTWTIEELVSTTGAQPTGQSINGVLGKWEYVHELGAFVALNEYNAGTKDAEVWLYKPFATAVPEPETYALMLAGLLAIAAKRRRTTLQ